MIPCWGKKNIVPLILSFSLGPLKEISSKKVMSISQRLKVYLLEVNSVGCSADRVTQLDLKGVRNLWLSFSKKQRKHSWLSVSCSSTLSVGVMLCVLESWRQFLTCLYWVYPTAELSLGCFGSICRLFKMLVLMLKKCLLIFSLHLWIIKNHTLMKYRCLPSGRLVNKGRCWVLLIVFASVGFHWCKTA